MLKQIKKIFISLTSCLLIVAMPLQVHAQEGGLVANLTKGESAPFDGVLFDLEAAAKILADQEFGLLECKLQLEYFEKKQEAICDFEMSKLQLSLGLLEEKHEAIIEIKDKEIYELQEIIKGESTSKIPEELWFGGGFILGTLISLAIFFAATEAAK